jgi:hypothetical protein
MPTNRSRPETWDADIKRSVDFYNAWFLGFAPEAYRKERVTASESVETHRASLIVADRVCDANADQIIRNAQESRQLKTIKEWLGSKDYRDRTGSNSFDDIPPCSYLLRSVVPGRKEDGSEVSMPIDMVIMPRNSKAGDLPILVEAKSAGDFANTNKRRKEEATKLDQLRRMHGSKVQFVLFLCGYFDRGYLQYEAAEGIEWVWEHRPADFEEFGL